MDQAHVDQYEAAQDQAVQNEDVQEASGLAFVRHGQTDWNAEGLLQGGTDVPLNDHGRLQAHDTAQLLKKAGPWDVIVSSPMKRALETAKILAEELGCDHHIKTYAELKERSYGDLEGQCRVTQSPEVQDAMHPPAHIAFEDLDDYEKKAYEKGLLPNVEPSQSVGERGAAAVRQICEDFPGQRVVIVSHGTLIRLTMDALTGERHPSVENAEIVYIPGPVSVDA
ncbi:histidine phosphatase family protein [Neomicrococcus lactis]|uniref:Putative phosphoglycerate mutase n=1 Tax=Neomicrococcus lactis TaxID=732241 RepID=A0A7W8YBR2_9MICC|nr:histidine phosphatase family protein [Neomicrococcus lactis]MBB5598614.1 putative phosphoglycerate mutase [Neomicrococcus lactis]